LELEYWNNRGRLGYKFKGEEFYTISPPHMYFDRRKWLCKAIKNFYGVTFHSGATHLLDWGCGDGWWSMWFYKNFGSKVTCFDPSGTMLDRAKRRFQGYEHRNDLDPQIVFTKTLNTVGKNFDIVLCIAVLAHVPDLQVRRNIEAATRFLDRNKGGVFFIFRDDWRGKDLWYWLDSKNRRRIHQFVC
jgi:2-polyprenyl-3-methyl-5-hydroxy-6-metoxy-1,4-benzoquinol methylase